MELKTFLEKLLGRDLSDSWECIPVTEESVDLTAIRKISCIDNAHFCNRDRFSNYLFSIVVFHFLEGGIRADYLFCLFVDIPFHPYFSCINAYNAISGNLTYNGALTFAEWFVRSIDSI